MKKLLYMAAFPLLLIALTGCKKDNGIGEPDLGYLKLVSSNVRFDYKGGVGEIIADTDQSLNAVLDESGKEWCEISTAGKTVTVTVNLNDGIQSRNTFVTLTAGDRSVVVPVSQSPL